MLFRLGMYFPWIWVWLYVVLPFYTENYIIKQLILFVTLTWRIFFLFIQRQGGWANTGACSSSLVAVATVSHCCHFGRWPCWSSMDQRPCSMASPHHESGWGDLVVHFFHCFFFLPVLHFYVDFPADSCCLWSIDLRSVRFWKPSDTLLISMVFIHL
jgi:hypothetical protein